MQYTVYKVLVASTALGHTLLLFIAVLLPLGIYKRRLSHQSQPCSMEGQTKYKAEQYSLNSILDTIPMAIMIVDNELNIGYINRAWEQLVGYTWEEVVGKKLTELQQLLQEEKTTSCPRVRILNPSCCAGKSRLPAKTAKGSTWP